MRMFRIIDLLLTEETASVLFNLALKHPFSNSQISETNFQALCENPKNATPKLASDTFWSWNVQKNLLQTKRTSGRPEERVYLSASISQGGGETKAKPGKG